MASNSRGNAMSSSTPAGASFARLSLRNFLLNGPFPRTGRSRRSYGTASVTSRENSDVAQEASGGAGTRRCGIGGRLNAIGRLRRNKHANRFSSTAHTSLLAVGDPIPSPASLNVTVNDSSSTSMGVDSIVRNARFGSRLSVSAADSSSGSAGKEEGVAFGEPGDVKAAELRSSSLCSSVDVSGLKECQLCCVETTTDQFPKLISCSHTACLTCLKQYLATEISESRVNIMCPSGSDPMHPTDIHQILNNQLLSFKFEDFMLRRVLSMDPDTRWCPAPDCGYAVIASGCAGCPKLQCERPGCHSFFCYHCKAEWHPNQTCDMARVQRTPHMPYATASHAEDDVKACPRCQVLIVKMDDGSCNHMTCSVCAAEFCWLCMKEVSDLHYLSPSGCTFWGKKPWSRKKKVLWQLGTLVGAPLGIALLAGLAVPAIIIGIPIWAGRKVHARYSAAGRHKRNLMVVCSVVWSSVVSPIIAGVAVTIGVPILLAYVYGVVPISLCRSGGCGVITSAAGVRIAFDDEHQPTHDGSAATVSLTTSSLAGLRNSSRLTDGAVTGARTNAEGMEGRDAIDRDSSQEVAATTSSLTGSFASISCLLPQAHKLEVQVEVGGPSINNQGGRHSSVEEGFQTSSAGHRTAGFSDAVSLAVSERSTTTVDTDTASTRALAGSIAPVSHEYTSKNWHEHQSESASLAGVTNVAQAGDSASTVMLDHADVAADSVSTVGALAGDSVSTAGGLVGDSVSATGGDNVSNVSDRVSGRMRGAAPSILSSISATTTVNLFIPPCAEEEAELTDGNSEQCCASHHKSVSGSKFSELDSRTFLRERLGEAFKEIGEERHCDSSDFNGSDPRLDSVSAIITARKLSSKGVTFSMSSSCCSHSRDHISLTLEDDDSVHDDGVSAVSGLSASGVSGISASGASSVSAAEHLQDSHSSYAGYSEAEGSDCCKNAGDCRNGVRDSKSEEMLSFRPLYSFYSASSSSDKDFSSARPHLSKNNKTQSCIDYFSVLPQRQNHKDASLPSNRGSIFVRLDSGCCATEKASSCKSLCSSAEQHRYNRKELLSRQLSVPESSKYFHLSEQQDLTRL